MKKFNELMEGESFSNSTAGSNADFRDRIVEKAISPLHKKLIVGSYFVGNETNGRIRSDKMRKVFAGKKSNFNLDSVSGVVKDTKGVVIVTQNGSDFYWEYVVMK